MAGAQSELRERLESETGRAAIYQSGRFYLLDVEPSADLRARIIAWHKDSPSLTLKQVREMFGVEAPTRTQRVSAYGDLAWVAALNRVRV